MRIYVNGDPREFSRQPLLLEVINELNLQPERIAAELNGLVVPRVQWPTTRLNEDDRIEIVHFVGGGHF